MCKSFDNAFIEKIDRRTENSKEMEYLKVTAGGKSSPKREMFRSSRSRQQRSMMSNLMEAITQVSGGGDHVVSETKEDGVVRMKFKVRKQDLRQMLEVMKSGKTNNNNNAQPSPLSVEQRLNLLRRKHILRSTSMMMKAGRRGGSWRPVLQSIPEEL